MEDFDGHGHFESTTNSILLNPSPENRLADLLKRDEPLAVEAHKDKGDPTKGGIVLSCRFCCSIKRSHISVSWQRNLFLNKLAASHRLYYRDLFKTLYSDN